MRTNIQKLRKLLACLTPVVVVVFCFAFVSFGNLGANGGWVPPEEWPAESWPTGSEPPIGDNAGFWASNHLETDENAITAQRAFGESDSVNIGPDEFALQQGWGDCMPLFTVAEGAHVEHVTQKYQINTVSSSLDGAHTGPVPPSQDGAYWDGVDMLVDGKLELKAAELGASIEANLDIPFEPGENDVWTFDTNGSCVDCPSGYVGYADYFVKCRIKIGYFADWELATALGGEGGIFTYSFESEIKDHNGVPHSGAVSNLLAEWDANPAENGWESSASTFTTYSHFSISIGAPAVNSTARVNKFKYNSTLTNFSGEAHQGNEYDWNLAWEDAGSRVVGLWMIPVCYHSEEGGASYSTALLGPLYGGGASG